MKEQRDQMVNYSKNVQTKKKMKFNLLGNDDSDVDYDFNFLSHKGKKLDDLDDFKDKIESDDEYDDRDIQKGIMNEQMVNELNFGRGNENIKESENIKKTREEIHQEIMEKSKAYKYHAQEIKEASATATR